MTAITKWIRASKYHEVSDCGRYSVCAVRLADNAPWTFNPWLIGTKNQPGVQLEDGFPNAELARHVCEQHALTTQTTSIQTTPTMAVN